MSNHSNGAHMLDANEIAGICLMLVGVVILTPILCYSLYEFHSISKTSTDLLRYRYKTLVYAMNALAILSFCTERVLIILSQILHEISIPLWLPYIAEYSFMFAFYILFLIKTWLSFFSREYHRKLAQLTWYQELNPNTRKTHHFILKYKHKLGDLHYLMKIGAALFLLQMFIEIVLDIAYEQDLDQHIIVDHIITLMYTLSVFIISFVLWFKTRDFNDIYHIKKETQYQTYILLFILFTEFVTVTYELYHELYDHDSVLYPIDWIVMLILEDILWFSIALISTAYPVYLYKQTLIKSQTKPMIHPVNSDNKSPMLQILACKDGFKSFMLHLVKEYSTENLLFILELVQIKCEFQNNVANLTSLPMHGYNMGTEEEQKSNTIHTYLVFAHGKVYTQIRLPLKLQKSPIIQKHNDIRKQMMYLYNKYVKAGSEHEINISYGQRNKLCLFFESNLNDHIESNREIFTVMDETAIELVRLLYGSFQRFRYTVVYKEWTAKQPSVHRLQISSILQLRRLY